MQPRLEAPGRGSRLLVLAALLALLPAPGSVAQDSPPPGGEQPLPSRRVRLSSSSLEVQRAAQTAVSYLNYWHGSPSALRAPGPVRTASLKVIPGIGRTYILQFSTTDLTTGENLGTCQASVFYQTAKSNPNVQIHCSPDKYETKHREQDSLLYSRLTEGKEPSLELLRGLGAYGSSLIGWQMSTEDLSYTLKDIKNNVLPWKRSDGTLEVFYTVLFGDKWGEPSVSCHMRVAWSPSLPARVKYFCSPEDGPSESADGSGGESGSTDDYFIGVENNF